MTQLDTLVLALWVLYLVECLRWPSIGTIILASPWLRSWRLIIPAPLLVRLRRAVYLPNPLPPLGTYIHFPRWPISLSPDGACAWTPFAHNPGARPEQTGAFLRWEQIRSADRDGQSVIVNGKPFLLASDEHQAHIVASLLRKLPEWSPAERAAAIVDMLTGRFDEKAARQSIQRVREMTAHVRLLAHLLFLTLLVVAPVAAYFLGLGNVWPWWLAMTALWWLQLLIAFHRTHRELLPDAPHGSTIEPIVTMILLPVAAIRAADRLWSESMPQFESLTVAQAVLAPASFREFAASVVRDARHHAVSADQPQSLTARETITWFHARYVEQVESCVRAAGLEPDELDRAPEWPDPEVRSYCPRCHNEFVITVGECHLCGGVELRPLPRV